MTSICYITNACNYLKFLCNVIYHHKLAIKTNFQEHIHQPNYYEDLSPLSRDKQLRADFYIFLLATTTNYQEIDHINYQKIFCKTGQNAHIL
jgi:hypothetical protein